MKDFIKISLVILLFSLGLFLGRSGDSIIYGTKYKVSMITSRINAIPIVSEKSIQETCNNKTLKDFSYCLREQIKPFYKYTEREDEIQSFEDLKNKGGDCFDWANLYHNLSINAGFNSKIHIINLTNERDHAFTTISDKEGYCIMEQQLNPQCTNML